MIINFNEFNKDGNKKEIKPTELISVFWMNDKLLYVQIGDNEPEYLTPEDAVEKYRNNSEFVKVYNNLMIDNKNYQLINKSKIMDDERYNVAEITRNDEDRQSLNKNHDEKIVQFDNAVAENNHIYDGTTSKIKVSWAKNGKDFCIQYENKIIDNIDVLEALKKYKDVDGFMDQYFSLLQVKIERENSSNQIDDNFYIPVPTEEELNYKSNPNVSVYWINDNKGILYVRIGDKEVEEISVKDAIERFSHIPAFVSEYNHLVSGRMDFKPIPVNKQATDHKVISFSSTNNVHEEISNEEEKYKQMQKEIDDKIASIIDELGLEISMEPEKQLDNACKVQKYLVNNGKYDINAMKIKDGCTIDNIMITDLYGALINNKGVCSSYSLAFKKILDKVGVKTECLLLTNKKTNVAHQSNIVLLNDKWYIFDSTQCRSIHDIAPEIDFAFTGIGGEEYLNNYKEVGVLPERLDMIIKTLPDNISKEDIPVNIIKGYMDKINDYSNERHR